jgi:5-methylcytosine-specific restriction endonuclease McrA
MVFANYAKKQAPFNRTKDNSPYLEVHHKKRLSEGGEDSVKNAIALCPIATAKTISDKLMTHNFNFKNTPSPSPQLNVNYVEKLNSKNGIAMTNKSVVTA